MYQPEYTQVSDRQLSYDLIKENPLGLVVSLNSSAQQYEANYYPFFLQAEGSDYCLVGHIARANPHWRSLDGNHVQVHFLGPNAYISPSLYKNSLNVPTWNYAAVQVIGSVEVIENPTVIEDILAKSVMHFESQNGTHWNYDLPPEFKSKLTTAIVGIKVKINNIESKFKMSQNRGTEDYSSVFNFFATNASSKGKTISAWMERTRPAR